jgi:aspartyl-tRNA(Asn)/glutamyl-tRNA(Gln) amidotransferase subunit A
MTEDELKGLTLAGALRLIQRKQMTASELHTSVLDRIDRLNPRFNAFITIVRERTTANGFPVSVKDLYDTKDIRTTAGSRLYADRVPREDASVVTKLRAAGADIIGKTNLHEFAFGVTTINPYFGAARNPWDPERIAGGSSGGSAVAVALSMGLGSMGSDTGGSIRIPAALCGVVGLKPTYGRVSIKGMVPLSWSLDHAGPIAKTVEDTAILLGMVAGFDPRDPYSRDIEAPQYEKALTGEIKDLRIGVPRKYFYEQLAPEVSEAMRTALVAFERLGARITDVDLPSTNIHRGVWLQIASPEAYSYHERHLETHFDSYSPDVRGRLEAGRELRSIDYLRAQRARTIMKRECQRVFETVDVLITPTVPIAAPRIDRIDKTEVAALGRFTRFFNIVGLPAISVPCGFTSEGLPIGMQIAGKAFDESTVLRAAHAYEQDAKWIERRPEL